MTLNKTVKPHVQKLAKPIPTPIPKTIPTPKPIPKTTPKTIPTPKPIKKLSFVDQLFLLAQLMRLNKPIGILLLLWPTLWSLLLAAKGAPRWDLLVIFSVGVVIMRSAGCVINDFADRKIDGKVTRTNARPLATAAISHFTALSLFVLLCLMAFALVLQTDPFTIQLSLGGVALAIIYPFMKRYTHLPQVFLGAAFAWSIPMAFAAQAGELNKNIWLIYFAVVLWTVVYDTFYAMVDRSDDLKIGVKSTAILFGDQDRLITGVLQAMTLCALVLVGRAFGMTLYYYLSLVLVAALFCYQQWLIRFREPSACFKAFLNNHWVGAVVFLGIVTSL
jgi:4-hydroxybenzoate polyprenyltransferase